jgi:hypothetical protein
VVTSASVVISNFEHAIQISRERTYTEETCRLFMAAKLQRLLDLNAQLQAEAAAREQAWLAQNEGSRLGWARNVAEKLRWCMQRCCTTICTKQGRRCERRRWR